MKNNGNDNSDQLNPFPVPRYRIIIGEVRSLAGFNVLPSEVDIRKILKMKPGADVSKTTNDLMMKTRKMAKELVHPAALYGIFPRETINLQWCHEADKICLALVTIGPELELKVESLNNAGEIAQATVLDALGSGWIEGAVQGIDRTIGHEATLLGLRRDRRRSPGYHPWSLKGQEEIFKILPAESIHVELNESYIMIPRKSVSFAVPLYS